MYSDGPSKESVMLSYILGVPIIIETNRCPPIIFAITKVHKTYGILIDGKYDFDGIDLDTKEPLDGKLYFDEYLNLSFIKIDM